MAISMHASASDPLLATLTVIAGDLNDQDNVNKLRSLLHDESTAKKMYTNSQYADILEQIQAKFADHEKRAALYARIQTARNQLNPLVVAKSIHSSDGTFLFADENCEQVFQRPLNRLYECTIFSLISNSSKNYLRSRFGSEIFVGPGSIRSRILTYLTLDESTTLTSRISYIHCTTGEGETQPHILIQTRRARHQVQLRKQKLSSVQKMYDDSQVPIYLQTASSFLTESPTLGFGENARGTQFEPVETRQSQIMSVSNFLEEEDDEPPLRPRVRNVKPKFIPDFNDSLNS